jgi:hypothetical protein
MPKFEYQFVTFNPAGEENHRVYRVNGRIDEKWAESKSLSISDYSNMLGEQGWDLFYYEPDSKSQYIRVIFKRRTE